MKPILFILVLLLSSASLKAQDLSRFFDTADTFFMTYVSNGRVDYNTLQEQPEPLHDLMAQLARIKVTSANETMYKAFWINAYNLAVIQGIVERYPIASPLDVTGFFDSIKYEVGSENITLNDIENKKLRAVFDDARIHFVLVCGAKGCPPLIPMAYRTNTLEQQLTEQTTKALNDDGFIQLSRKKVGVSEIFKWYREDFTSTEIKVVDYINRYRKQPISNDLKVVYYPYDWRLNIQE